MRGNAARALLWAIAVLGLLGLVTIAATGSTTTGSGQTRRPPYVLFDTALALAAVAMLASLLFLVYVFAHRRPTDYRGNKGGLVTIVVMLAFALLLGTSDLPAWLRSGQNEPQEPPTVGEAPILPEDTGPADRPGFTWLPLAMILSLAAIAAAAMVLAERRRRRTREVREAVEEAVADVLDEALDDLRAEADPRRAVIAAYARLERVLAAHGLARSVYETPEEYLVRIFGRLDVDFGSIRRLTDLFAVAKFSQHVVDEEMKEEAIGILELIRDELRTAETRDGERRPRALPVRPA